MQAQGPTTILKMGRYTLSRYPEGAWDFSDHSLGATGRGPIRATINFFKWRREFRSKPPGYWAQ